MTETVQKITDAELTTIKSLQTEYSEITAKLGRLSVQKMLMDKDLEGIKKEIENQQNKYLTTNEKEDKFLETISKTYGEGKVNTETGEFTPNK